MNSYFEYYFNKKIEGLQISNERTLALINRFIIKRRKIPQHRTLPAIEIKYLMAKLKNMDFLN